METNQLGAQTLADRIDKYDIGIDCICHQFLPFSQQESIDFSVGGKYEMKKQKQNKQSEMHRLFFSVCSAISADLFVPASDSAPFRSTEVLLGGNWSCEEYETV